MRKPSFLIFLIRVVPLNATFLCFTLCRDRDAKSRWANSVISDNWNIGFGGIGGTIVSGLVKQSVGRVFR